MRAGYKHNKRTHIFVIHLQPAIVSFISTRHGIKSRGTKKVSRNNVKNTEHSTRETQKCMAELLCIKLLIEAFCWVNWIILEQPRAIFFLLCTFFFISWSRWIQSIHYYIVVWLFASAIIHQNVKFIYSRNKSKAKKQRIAQQANEDKKIVARISVKSLHHFLLLLLLFR